jgi:monoamine oxidase
MAGSTGDDTPPETPREEETKKPGNPSTKTRRRRRPRIAVVGAGFAGLCAAQQIAHAGGDRVDVVVLEATAHWGGRCRQEKTGFCPWKALELGAEFIHGRDTALFKLCAARGFPALKLITWAQGDGELNSHPVGGVSAYYIGREKRFVRPFHQAEYLKRANAGIRRANEAVWGLAELSDHDLTAFESRNSAPAPPGGGASGSGAGSGTTMPPPRTLRQYLEEDCAVPPAGVALMESGYANTLCSTASQMGLKETARLWRRWDDADGGDDFRMLNSFSGVIKHLARGTDIRLRWPVMKISVAPRDDAGADADASSRRSNSGDAFRKPPRVTLTRAGSGGETLKVDRVIVTASLACMQQGTIAFDPPLPSVNTLALRKMTMYGAAKISLLFTRRFWPKGLQGMICADTFVPELYFDEPERVGSLTEESALGVGDHAWEQPKIGASDGEGVFVCTTFVCAAVYDRVTALPRMKIRDGILALCDEIFGERDLSRMCPDPRLDEQGLLGPPDVNSGTPATDSFVDMIVMDWGKMPYVRGGYCSPGPEVSELVRSAAARPVDDTVFFGGEHTNPGHYMTLHAAMESGIKAGQDVLRSLELPSKEIPISML